MSFPNAKEARAISDKNSKSLIDSQHKPSPSSVSPELRQCQAQVLSNMRVGVTFTYCSTLDEVGVNFFKSRGFQVKQIPASWDGRDPFYDISSTKVSW